MGDGENHADGVGVAVGRRTSVGALDGMSVAVGAIDGSGGGVVILERATGAVGGAVEGSTSSWPPSNSMYTIQKVIQTDLSMAALLSTPIPYGDKVTRSFYGDNDPVTLDYAPVIPDGQPRRDGCVGAERRRLRRRSTAAGRMPYLMRVRR